MGLGSSKAVSQEGKLEPGKNLNKSQLECFRLVCDRVGQIDYRTGCFRYEMSPELLQLSKVISKFYAPGSL